MCMFVCISGVKESPVFQVQGGTNRGMVHLSILMWLKESDNQNTGTFTILEYLNHNSK